MQLFRSVIVFVLTLGLFLPSAFAHAYLSVSVQSLWPSATVLAGTTVSFSIVTTGFTNPTYVLSDARPGTTVKSSNIDTAGTFSWTTTNDDGGTHYLNISVTDENGNTGTTQAVITVIAPVSITIQNFSATTSVDVGTTVTFNTSTTGGLFQPAYAITDSMSISSISSNNLNSSGYFNWIPERKDAGVTHTLTVTVSDFYGKSASTTQAITVNPLPSAEIQNISPGSSVVFGNAVTFKIAPSRFTNPIFRIRDSFLGSSITNYNINGSGYFSWTPGSNDVGSHNLAITVSDPFDETTIYQALQVTSAGLTATTTAATINATVGAMVSIPTVVNGFSYPSFLVSDYFGGKLSSVKNANINTSGLFTWIPTSSDVGTHVLTISADDTQYHHSTLQRTVVVYGSGSTVPSGSTSSYTFTSYLSPGLTSMEVANLQTVLVQLGLLTTTPSGYYGTLTKAAVMKFQAQKGLEQTGSVGPGTRAALNGSANSNPGTSSTVGSSGSYKFYNPLSIGSRGTDVTELQKRLIKEGLLSGEATGYFGVITSDAVKKFQTQHGIEAAGNVGPATRAALNQ